MRGISLCEECTYYMFIMRFVIFYTKFEKKT